MTSFLTSDLRSPFGPLLTAGTPPWVAATFCKEPQPGVSPVPEDGPHPCAPPPPPAGVQGPHTGSLGETNKAGYPSASSGGLPSTHAPRTGKPLPSSSSEPDPREPVCFWAEQGQWQEKGTSRPATAASSRSRRTGSRPSPARLSLSLPSTRHEDSVWFSGRKGLCPLRSTS